ncbi:MAG: hypothetical protein EBR82_11210 [Caulobacteraceae bacterium]|nr:hypothetical protein [Caulobacteraceae bacterium]
MNIQAIFSNGQVDVYKGKRPVRAAWQVVCPDGQIVSGHSLDRGARVWTAYPADAKGNQVGDCRHEHRKEWLSVNLADYPVWDI